MTKMPSPLDRVVDRLKAGPKSPGEDKILQWIEESMGLAKKWERHGEAWIRCHVISQCLKESATALLKAIESIDDLAEQYDTGIMLPFEDEASLSVFKEALKRFETCPHYASTEWDLNRCGKGRKRLPAAMVMLHVYAAQMMEKCEIDATTGKNGTIAWMGEKLCRLYGITLKKKSEKAAVLAKDMVLGPDHIAWKFINYHVLPDMPFGPLYLFQSNLINDIE